jgi:hypothetical protein
VTFISFFAFPHLLPSHMQLICSRVVFILDEVLQFFVALIFMIQPDESSTLRSKYIFQLQRVNQRFALLPSKLSLAQLNGTFIVDELLRRVGARRQRQVYRTFFMEENPPLLCRRADGVSSESSAASAGAPGPDSELFARQTSAGIGPAFPHSFSFNVSRSDSLLLDYTIVDIRADHRGIEVDSSGEVSLRGRGGTPFGWFDI